MKNSELDKLGAIEQAKAKHDAFMDIHNRRKEVLSKNHNQTKEQHNNLMGEIKQRLNPTRSK